MTFLINLMFSRLDIFDRSLFEGVYIRAAYIRDVNLDTFFFSGGGGGGVVGGGGGGVVRLFQGTFFYYFYFLGILLNDLELAVLEFKNIYKTQRTSLQSKIENRGNTAGK